jgi:hypothetical protein
MPRGRTSFDEVANTLIFGNPITALSAVNSQAERRVSSSEQSAQALHVHMRDVLPRIAKRCYADVKKCAKTGLFIGERSRD